MNKNKMIASIVIGVVVLAGLVGLITMANDDTVDAPETTAGTNETSTSTTPTTESSGAQTPATTNPASSSAVEIKDYAYSPASITVKKGTTVTWTNKDVMRHDISPDSESDAFKASELLDQGESYSFTFDTAGTYTYHCTPHPYMKGVVIVTE